MKTILLPTLIAFSCPSFADTVKEGNYIVIRGAIKGCEEWNFRILDVVKIEASDTVSLLSIPNIHAIGQSSEQIKKKLESEIYNRTGKNPTTMQVEILQSEIQYRLITEEYIMSLRLLLDEQCPFKGKRKHQNLEEDIEKLRKFELMESVVSAKLYNKSFKCVTPASWLHRTPIGAA